MQTQERNAEQAELLRGEFQPRYESNFAWANAAAIGVNLPQVRGYWPMTAHHDIGGIFGATNLASPVAAHQMPGFGAPRFQHDGLAGYVFFNGADYFGSADNAQWDILGTEAQTVSTQRGLTLGAWIRPQAPGTGAIQGVISKWAAAIGGQSYSLYLNAALNLVFSVGTGAVTVSVTSAAPVQLSVWQFVAGRFNPSTELACFINLTKATNAVGVPAALLNSASTLNIGIQYPISGISFGSLRDGFLCASRLGDYHLAAFYHQTRALLGA